MSKRVKPPTDAAIRREWMRIAPDNYLNAQVDSATSVLAWRFFRAGMLAAARSTSTTARLDLAELLYNVRAEFRRVLDQANRRVGRVPEGFPSSKTKRGAR